ncbi:M28 family peptidase [Actinomadura alba]|uniref:M28 family peptidase n=1 Tax=Actinomadura alba TaxID=406431 RepID=A0ABR7LM38_9ACTN|nr:M28 family peptidase [Actinomadura alba]MBC6465659.1 M28 family peptidase [Actinomadura alba]
MRIASRTATAVIAATATLVATAPAAGATGPADGQWLAHRLAQTTTGADAWGHLRAFDRIADGNDGVRATGTPGFAASADYAAAVLKAAGYRVRQQAVPYADFHFDAENARQISPAARQVRTLAMRWTPVTPPGGFTAPLVVAPTTSGNVDGCSAADYDGLPVQGSIVLVRRGSCGYANQQKVAAALGARAILIYLATPSPENIYRLYAFNRPDFTIPVGTVSQAQAEALAADAAQQEVRLHLELRGHEVTGTTTNLLAETRGGRSEHTVMAGAHLDSVSEGPGINDNASSVSALLATALRLAPHQHRVRNKVRFALWGAEELIDVGSKYYVANLSSRERADISLYINFEMIAAPNFVRFIMDSDASDQPPGSPPGPPGSGAVEEVFKQYSSRVGLPFAAHNIAAVGSDHEPFMAAGIPVGGMNGGALGVKTPAEAANFGGQAGQLYDRCYHQTCDTLSSLNRQALNENVPIIAWAVGRFATDVSDVEAGSGEAGPHGTGAPPDVQVLDRARTPHRT